MTFGFSGFSRSFGLFGSNTSAQCAPVSSSAGGAWGGHSGGSLFNGGFGGGHSGGLFGGLKGSFGKLPVLGHGQDDNHHDDDHHDDDDRSCDTGHGSSSGNTGGSTGGTGYPDIPANTAGITFHVDLEGDGINDQYIPIGRDSDTKTFEDYLAKARDQVAAEHPDVDPKDVIIKATITTQTGEESYYTFTGLEEDGATDAGDDSDDDNGSDDDCWAGNHNGGHDDGHGSASHGSSDDDTHGEEGRSCGNGHADFFHSLIGGGLSFDHGHDSNCQDDDDDGDDDRHSGHFDFDFC